MLTIFTVPKPFEGHIGIIQRNAIRSWTRLRPECQILLFGAEPGTKEVADQVGADWNPTVERNEYETPLLSSVFQAAEDRALFPLLCYVNADIILLSDFLDAAHRVASAKRRFLMVGQRWDFHVSEELAFNGHDWETELRGRVSRGGSLHPPDGSDYFVYPRGMIGPLPDFAVGRPRWDNWMIYHARTLRSSVIDVTDYTLVIHQNHGYHHVKGGTGETYEGPEGERNLALVGAENRLFTLKDVTHRLTGAGLVPLRGGIVDDTKRRLRTELVIAPAPLRPPLRALRAVWRVCKRLRRHPRVG